MTTAFCALTGQPISASTMTDLLGQEGLAYEALGAGVRDAIKCLSDAREFYALPEALGPGLSRFEGHLEQALAVLAELQSEADLQHL